jgi:GDP-mannose 6-dehydrogenase
VCEEIGRVLRNKTGWHLVVIRSTVLPGTMREMVVPVLEQESGKKAGTDFGLCHNPEFLREGTAVNDFNFPPQTVIGELDKASGEVLARLYERIPAPMVRTELETAEMLKYVNNSWHALKIDLPMRSGTSAKRSDAYAVMKIFCQDTKLNISPAYLMPGFAFGDSCLPKDLRVLTYQAKTQDLELPILTSIWHSNEIQVTRGIQMMVDKGHKRIGVLGFSFKAGTDGLRESPVVEVIERLLGKGYDLRVYDRNVNLASLVGANRDCILNRIPHISRLMVDRIGTVPGHWETVVIGNKDPEFRGVPEQLRPDQQLVDSARISEQRTNGHYEGICW